MFTHEVAPTNFNETCNVDKSDGCSFLKDVCESETRYVPSSPQHVNGLSKMSNVALCVSTYRTYRCDMLARAPIIVSNYIATVVLGFRCPE